MPYLRSLGSRVRALVQRLHGCTCVFAKSGADVRGERTCCPSDGPKKVTTTRAGPKRLARRKPRKLVFAWPKVAAPRASSFGLGRRGGFGGRSLLPFGLGRRGGLGTFRPLLVAPARLLARSGPTLGTCLFGLWRTALGQRRHLGPKALSPF